MLTVVLSFLTGIFAANATPHFIKGITKERFPTPFGDGPLVNLIAGWAMYVITVLLAVAAHAAERPVPAFAAAALGVLLMGIFHATIGAFGRGRTLLAADEARPGSRS
ncbi:hypothetical protein ABZ923_33895 [Streptomyces sp. NPDC046881]|uniref:hypothetical protein n=1 Tax=Streptomyces sp. NPDC046881 TaxID=3155374 RepID=UPI0033F63FDA